MMPDEETSAPTETTADGGAPSPATPDDPETVRALARETLSWCRDNANDPEALPRLNTVLQLVHDPVLSKDVLAAGDAIIRAVLAEAAPPPAVHAHMTVLFALLLEYDAARDGVDKLFVEWLRHPKSYGPAHATPADYQREGFVQRVGDLIGWGELDVKRDQDHLTRFALWVDTWTPKNKFRARRAVDLVKRNFPAPDVWNLIHFPPGNAPGGDRTHGQGHAPPHAQTQPQGQGQGHGQPQPQGQGQGRKRKRRDRRGPRPSTDAATDATKPATQEAPEQTGASDASPSADEE